MANEFKIKNGLIVSGSAEIEQDLIVRGTLTADEYHISVTSSSILYESGSTVFGNSLDDIHKFTGSVQITGSISLNGQAIGTGKLDETTFNSYTSSISSSIGELSSSIATTTSGLTSTITSLSSSLTSSIGSLSSSVASINNTQNGRLDSLETASGSIRTDFNSFTSSYTTVSGSLDSRLDVLEAYSGSQLVPSSSMSFRTLQTDVYCKNLTGVQINKGTVVRIVGATGDNPLIAPASLLTEGDSANTLGIATQDIPNDNFGSVITEGVLIGVNTSGMTAGDLLYLGENGTFTTTPPAAPNHGVRLGEVLRVQQNQGSIYVRIDNGMELNEAHDVIYSSGITHGDLLIRSGSVWKNGKSLEGNYSVTGSLTATSITGSINYNNLTNIPTLVSGSSQIVITGTTGYSTFSSSISTSIGFLSSSLATTTSDLSSSIGSLSSSVATTTLTTKNRVDSIETSTSSLNTFTSSASGRLTSLETASGSIRTDFNTYTGSNNTTNTTQDGRLTSIEGITGSISSLNTYTGSNNTVIGTLQTSTSSLNSYTSSNTTNIDAIHTSTGSFKSFSSSFDTAFGMSGADVTVKGNLTVSGTQTTVNSTTVAIGDNIIQLNGTGATNAGLVVRDATAPNTVSGSFLWDSTNDKWIAGALGSEDDVVLKTATQTLTNKTINASQLVDASVTNAKLQYSSLSIAGTSVSLNGSISAATILSGTGTVSGSSQISFNGITDKPTLVSGSSQITYGSISGIPSGIVSGSSQITFGSISGIPSGLVSGSSQISFGSISGVPSGLVSGSSQITNIANSQLTNSSFNIGTTSISLGRTSASQTLTGVSIDGNSATVTNGVYTSGDQTIAGVKTFSNKVVFNSAVANRPQFPGGILGLDTGDGNFDIWGISRDYYPSHATAANAWGLRWNGDNNDFEFVGGGTNKVILDMDGGVVTATTFSGALSGNATTATTAGALTSMNISQFTNNSGYITGINSSAVTTALGYTPYNATNPNGYITGISFANVSSKPTTISGYGITDAITTSNIGSQSVSNAATVASLTPFQFFNNMGQNHSTQTDFNSITNFGFRFVQGSTNGPGTGSSQFYGFSIGLGNDYAYSDYALQLAIPRYGASDKYISFRTREATTWGSWSKISAGYADSAGSVSGANVSGNISGNASNITSYTINQSVGTGNSPTFAGVKGSSYFDAQASSGFRIRNSNDSANVGGWTRRGLWEGNANYDPALWAETGYGLYFYSNGSANIRAYFDTSGHFLPGTNSTYNLGSSSLRWGTVFTSDLSLSNGIGDYTIVEGEEKLYLYNNKNNKVYSFVLQEEDPATATPKKS